MPEILLLPTTLNGRYAIERELWRRGLATVYLARDVSGGSLVAVTVSPGAANKEALSRAAAAAQLRHPGIVPTLDSGATRWPSGEDVVYTVSPYLEGEDLRQRLNRERHLPLDEVLRIAAAVAAPLDFAHQQRVIHGDLKPETILLRGSDVLLSGFGVAVVDPVSWASSTTPDVGPRITLAYVSPERLAGGRADARSDQYSFAAVLYEMLTGEPPFTGPNLRAIATKILADPPPRLTALRVVPRIVERAIHRGLSKSPTDRFASVVELVAALAGAAAQPPAATTRAPGVKRRSWRVPLIAAFVVLATGAGVALASRAVVKRRPATSGAHNQLTFTGTATSPALSPDGRSVLYIAGGRSLVVQRLDGGDPVEVIPPAGTITAARWTGDGTAMVVAMSRDSTERVGTFLVSATGSPPRRVLDDARPFDAGPGPTVIVRASGQPGRIEMVSLASGQVAQTIEIPEWLGAIAEIDWSPDYRWIAFTDARNGALRVIAAGGGVSNRVAAGARAIRWSPTSEALYFLSGPAGTVDLMRVGIDTRSGAPAGNVTRVTSLLAADAFDVGRGNRIVHTQTSRGAELRTFVLGGAGAARRIVEEQSLTEGPARLESASISPDGRWVAYSATRGAERDIHVVAFGGGSPRVVASSPAREESPSWAPDGASLTLSREDSSGRRIFIADAQTGSAARQGSLPNAPAGAARWSASGRHIAYYAQDLRRIVVINLQRRNESVVRLPDHVGTGHIVVPSPNGTQLLATTRVDPGDASALWLVFGGGRRWRRIEGPPGETFPIAWHRNGWIYLVRNRALATDHGAVHLELWRMRGPTGRAELVAPLPQGCGLSVSISADASQGVCNYVHVESDLYVASNLGTSGR